MLLSSVDIKVATAVISRTIHLLEAVFAVFLSDDFATKNFLSQSFLLIFQRLFLAFLKPNRIIPADEFPAILLG
jgi:hypothetical protein